MAGRKIYNEIVIDMNPESAGYKEILYEDSFQDNGQLIELKEVEQAARRQGKARKKVRETKKTELEDIAAAAAEKGLFGQVGSSLLPLLVLLGPAGMNPLTYGLLTSALTYGGRKGGELLAEDMPTDLEYYQEEAEEAEEKVTGGSLTEAILAGITAGAGQKIKMMKEATTKAQLLNQANLTNIPKNVAAAEAAITTEAGTNIIGSTKGQVIPDVPPLQSEYMAADLTTPAPVASVPKGAPPGGIIDALKTGKIADVTGDASINILDIIAAQDPKPGGVTGKDLYDPGPSPLSKLLESIKNLRKKD